MNLEHSDRSQLDDDLAALTDALFEGQTIPPTADTDLQSLGRIAQKLYQGIAAEEDNAAIRARLRCRLEREWQQTHRRKVWWPRQRAMRLVAMAAALVFVMVAVLLALDANNNGQAMQGTATGSLDMGGVLALALLLIVGVIVVVWALRRRR